MKRSDIASVLRLTVLAVILLLGDCQKYDTEIELAVVDKSCNSLTVMWTPIPEAQAYRLQYKPKLQPGNWKKVYTNETMFNITQLLPRTRYTVRVTKQGNQFFVRAVFRTLPRTDITDNVTVMASTNSLGIENKLTDAKITCWISGSDTVKNITILGMSREVVDGLSPNTTYSVDCVEVDEEGQYQCMEYNGTVTTLLEESPTVPGQPTNIAVNKTCNSLTLSWLPPGEDGGSIVTDYNVTVVNGSEDGPLLSVPAGGNTTVSITSLKPNTTYTVHIRAKNSAGLGPPAVKSVTTEEASPPLTVTSRSARVVSILPVANSASKSVDRCTLTAHYTFNTSESGGLYRVAFYTTSQGLNISSLLPDTAYSLVCTALLPVHGCTSSFTQFTFKTLPWVTPQVRVGNSFLQNNHLHQSISWSRPPHHTSQLHYIVKYGPSSVVDRPTHPSVSTTTSSNTTVILTLPIPTTPVVYNVWVAAVSDVGQGEYRMTHFNYKEPSPPENITVINETCNSLSVQWSPPSDTGGLAITGYTVGMVNNISSETNVTYTSDTEVQIRVTNILGASRPASATYARNNGYCSGQQLAEPELNLMITLPQSKDSINYSCTLSPGNQTIVTSSGDITLTDLSPNTAFSVRCFVCENREDLCYEENKSSDESSESCPSDNASILLNVGLFLAGLINGTVGTLLAGVPIYILCKKCIFERRKRNISESNYSLGDYSPGDYSVDSESTQLHVYASVDKENKGSSERYVNISRKSSRTVEEEVYDNIDDVKMEINEAYSDSLRLSANYL